MKLSEDRTDLLVFRVVQDQLAEGGGHVLGNRGIGLGEIGRRRPPGTPLSPHGSQFLSKPIHRVEQRVYAVPVSREPVDEPLPEQPLIGRDGELEIRKSSRMHNLVEALYLDAVPHTEVLEHEPHGSPLIEPARYVQGHIEAVFDSRPRLSDELMGVASDLVVPFEDEHPEALFRKNGRATQSSQSRADHDRIPLVSAACHRSVPLQPMSFAMLSTSA